MSSSRIVDRGDLIDYNFNHPMVILVTDFHPHREKNILPTLVMSGLVTMQRLFNISSPWHHLPGVAYGLQQASVWGHIQVTLPANYDFSGLDEMMDRFIVELTPRTSPYSNTSHALACRAIHWVTSLQRQHKIPISYFYYVKLLENSKGATETFFVAMPVSAIKATQEAFMWVANTIRAYLIHDRLTPSALVSIEADYEKLEHALKRFSLPGQNQISIYQAALEMDIPLHSVIPGTLRLGTGYHSRWLESTISDRSPGIGIMIAHDKMKTATVLRQAGLPAPVHDLVRSSEQAIHISHKFGYPVVIKPTDQEQGRGVYADLRTDNDVAAAFDAARKFSENILVEKHFEGIGHRLTVCNGVLIKATLKMPGGVIGDGIRTIEQLVDEAQREPQTRQLHAPKRLPLDLDEEALSLLIQKGLTLHSVPEKDDYICLRRKNNATTGGRTIALNLDEIHPDNKTLATRAANALRLDIAGVDLLIPDISKSWLETGALICEINAKPQTDPRTMFKVLSHLTDHSCRIPVHLLICQDIPSTEIHNRAVDMAIRLECNGWSSITGVWINQQRLTGTLGNGFDAARIVLNCSETKAALCLMTVQEILEFGLPTDLFESIRMFSIYGAMGKLDEKSKQVIGMVERHANQIVLDQ